MSPANYKESDIKDLARAGFDESTSTVCDNRSPVEIRVELFQGKPGLLQLAPAWRLLTDRLENRRHFHCVEWYISVAETFEAHSPASKLPLVGVFAPSELLAVLPFRAIQIEIAGIKLRATQLLSGGVESETARDFIMTPALANSGFFHNFVHILDQNDASWDVISLRGILDDSYAALALKSSPNLPFIKKPGGAWGKIDFISCEHDGQAFDRLSKGFKQNLRTAHNKLKSMRVDFVSARDPDALLALYPDFLEVESSGWKGAQGTSGLLPVRLTPV